MMDLCFRKATELADLIATRQVSAREVMVAHLAQIECVNPRVNAIVTLVADQGPAEAALADERQARGNVPGRSMGCRLLTRISSSPKASGRLSARPFTSTLCRRKMR